jgi:hypothetical protein
VSGDSTAHPQSDGKKEKISSMSSDWNEGACWSRIADDGKLQRFEGCSPNVEEIGQYRGYALSGGRSPRALVLGMTPELPASQG